jgi:hypothetical protein
VLAPLSRGYSPHKGRSTTCYSPVRHYSPEGEPFDLHVLCTPPAFVLSQDQTLQTEFCGDYLYLQFTLIGRTDCFFSSSTSASYLVFCFCLSFHSSVVKVRGTKEPVVPAPARQHTDLTHLRFIWLVLFAAPFFVFSQFSPTFVIIQDHEGDVKVISCLFFIYFRTIYLEYLRLHPHYFHAVSRMILLYTVTLSNFDLIEAIPIAPCVISITTVPDKRTIPAWCIGSRGETRSTGPPRAK